MGRGFPEETARLVKGRQGLEVPSPQPENPVNQGGTLTVSDRAEREWTCPRQPQLNIFNYIMVQFCLDKRKRSSPRQLFPVFPLNTKWTFLSEEWVKKGIAHRNVVSCFCPVLTSILVLPGHQPSAFQGKITAQGRFEPGVVLGGPRSVHNLTVPVLGLSCDSGRAGENQSRRLHPQGLLLCSQSRTLTLGCLFSHIVPPLVALALACLFVHSLPAAEFCLRF